MLVDSPMQHPYPTQSPAPSTLPDDFSDRLVRFKEAAGLSWRALAKELGVNPYRLREWRRGVTPSTPHLIRLLGLAEQMGLGEVLSGSPPLKTVRCIWQDWGVINGS